MSRAGRNRLDEEASPYLAQHADNPVHWQPWDDAALAEARERDVPIFLSVGYSACHWCHVMEDESFSNERVADVLNESFVPIKVDREERPDIDSIYQTICQLVSGRGGWPLSVWLTPDGRPFYVGTYFPREERRGMPGFLDLLERFAHTWEADRDEVENRADQWTAALRDNLEETPDRSGEVPGGDVLGTAAQAALRGADTEFGGFGSGGPKFPQPGRLHVLLRAYARSGRDEALRHAVRTFDAMAGGGVYDHLGGGFHRYATDRQWTVPHFEKMLYDNAEIPRAYLAASQLTGEKRYAEVARETFAFLDRELSHPEGGFYSTLDAQSGGEEGTFYVWTPASVRDALAGASDDGDPGDPELLADLFCERYGVTEAGNFEGKTVLTVSATVDELATEYGLDAATVESHLDAARDVLVDAREERTRPARDEKILAGWNGLAVSALAAGARAFGSSASHVAPDPDAPGSAAPDPAARAERALDFVRERLWSDGRLSRRWKDGDVKVDGYLEDYAFLGRGAFDLYSVTGDVDHLSFALSLARRVVEAFWDDEEGTIYFTPADGEALVTRPQELRDQSTPSSLGVAVQLLLDLDGFTDDDFADVAERTLATHENAVEGSPLEHLSLALAADSLANGSPELTVAAEDARMPDGWRETLAGRYVPGLVVAPRPASDADLEPWLDELGLDEAPPVWAGRESSGGEPTAYACAHFTCSAPTHDLDAALSWFEDADANGENGG